MKRAAVPYFAIRASSFKRLTLINLWINAKKASLLYRAIRKKAPCPIYEAAVDTITTVTALRCPVKARNPAAIRTLSPSKKVRMNMAI